MSPIWGGQGSQPKRFHGFPLCCGCFLSDFLERGLSSCGSPGNPKKNEVQKEEVAAGNHLFLQFVVENMNQF